MATDDRLLRESSLQRRHQQRIQRLKLRRLTQPYLTQASRTEQESSSNSQLDAVYVIVERQLMRHQSYTTGLFPRYSTDEKYGHVRDSIYCALACWTTSVAYQRLTDDDRGRESELRQSAAKTMRGVLHSWMMQAEQLERFKADNTEQHALHVVFDLQQGTAVGGREHNYNHLQIDVVALYLLALVNMIASGVQLVFTQAEVRFVQNLVFYIERAYRTPDYGMWERGTRYNDGTRELHASSLGLTKAALEAVNGFNLYGAHGTSSSVIYVDIDAHNRNRATFEAILPRESNSKNTDAALLPTVGYPGFAIHDPKLIADTKAKVLRHLGGKHGIKRFLRDGYKTELEDLTKRFYDVHETSKFNKVECQWPMFYGYLAIDEMLEGNAELGEKYLAMLEEQMTPDNEGMQVVPECFCLAGGDVESLYMCVVGSIDGGYFLWAQAIYVIALLLKNKLIFPTELDPIYRHMPASQRPKLAWGHSTFQGNVSNSQPVVQIALISESRKLQVMLSTYGIQTQTPHEVEPVQIWPSWRLVKVFNSLGKYDQLGLSGRPPRPVGALGTAKIFRIFGDTVICYPLLFETSDFYVGADPLVLMEDIKKDLKFVAARWTLAGRPTRCILLRESNIRGEDFENMLELLTCMKNGSVDGTRVRVGRVQNLLSAGCVERVDFCSSSDVSFGEFEPFREVDTSLSDYASLREISRDVSCIQVDDKITRSEVQQYRPERLIETVKNGLETRLRTQAFALAELWDRFSKDFKIDDVTVAKRMENLYRQATVFKSWFVVRFCATRLRKIIDSLAPSITTLLVRGKRVTVGDGRKQEMVPRPMAPDQVGELIFAGCPSENCEAAALQQEVLVECANLVQNSAFFDGIVSIRICWLIDAMRMILDYQLQSIDEQNKKQQQQPLLRLLMRRHRDRVGSFSTRTTAAAARRLLDVYDLSPAEIKKLLYQVLQTDQLEGRGRTVYQWRRLKGAINRCPANFHDSVWKILERAPAGLVIAKNHLAQQPTLSDMTEYEMSFAFHIEDMLCLIADPEYRAAMVELLMVVATIFDRNPELAFKEKVDMDAIFRHAVALFSEDERIAAAKGEEQFYQLPFTLTGKNGSRSTSAYFCRAVVDVLFRSRVKTLQKEAAAPTTDQAPAAGPCKLT